MREQIFSEIDAEREHQDGKWGNEFDDQNTVNDWAAYMNIYLSKATTMGAAQEQVRESILKVTAIGVAALEGFDRNGGFAKRHYD